VRWGRAGRGTGVDDSVMLQTVCHQLTKKPFIKAVSGTLFGSASPMYSSDQFVCGPVAPISRHLVTWSTARRLGGFYWLAANARHRHTHPRLLHGRRAAQLGFGAPAAFTRKLMRRSSENRLGETPVSTTPLQDAVHRRDVHNTVQTKASVQPRVGWQLSVEVRSSATAARESLAQWPDQIR